MALTDIGYIPGRAPSGSSTVTRSRLARSGTHVLVGSSGPRYKTKGYNAAFVPNIYTSAQTLNTQDKRDAYFSQMEAGSLTRFRAYAPPASSGISWNTQLDTLTAILTDAEKYDQRLMPCFTTWSSIDNTADAFGGKSATWWTSQLYAHSVSGSSSFEDWVTAVIKLGPWDIGDLLNEPADAGAANTAAIVTFVNYMSGVIKNIDPDVLVCMGIDVISSVGGATAYQTINAAAGIDLCTMHDYAAQGFVNTDIGCVAGARAVGKPWIMDETGAPLKAWYGSSGDADKDDTGWPGVSSQAQGGLIEGKLQTALAEDDCVGVLVYSYMDSSNGGGQDLGVTKYEPTNESRARKAVRDVPLQGYEFNNSSLASLSTGGWLDGAQAFRYARGATMDKVIQRQATNTISVTSATAPKAGRYGKHGGWSFNGAQFMDLGFIKAWGTAYTHMWAFVPAALPSAGAYCYLLAPQGAALGLMIRINPAGNFEVGKYSTPTGALTATDGTSTNTVNLNEANSLAVVQNTSTGALTIILNGQLTALTGKNPTYAAANARIGADQAGSNGFKGVLLEEINEQIMETNTNVGRTLAYYGRRYDVAA